MESSSFNLIQHYWPIAIVVVFLGAILVGFPLRFVLPATQLRAELKRATSALRKIQEKAGGAVVDLDAIEREAMSSPSLSRPWREFAQTLRPERREDESGRLQIIKWRAPALAEMFFSEQALVDVRLKTEFYKHLPGILTGLGIIGTFSGLIIGLTDFDVSLEPVKAQEQLKSLVELVGHAFIVSAIAIAMAMLFTWIEKSLVAAIYRQVEELRQIIDSLFGASAGEEHLERIAVATETFATQALQIKDALVADLRQLLDSQSARAAEISTQSARQISADTRAITVRTACR